MEQKDILTRMRRNQFPFDSVRIIGGATNSRVWNQIQADMYRLPCQTLVVEDAAVVGAALMAGVAVGIFAGIREGVDAMVRVKADYLPDTANADRYDEMYQIYCSAYEYLKAGGVFEKLSRLQAKY